MPFAATTAEQLEDLASRLDAGLPCEDATPGEPVVATLRRRLRLREWEWATLTAAETAGSLPAVLRRLATARQESAALRRQVLGALAYPALVLALCAIVAMFMLATGMAPRGWLWLSAGLVGGTAMLAGLLAVRLRDPTLDGDRLPFVGRLVRQAGEIPYLVALAALYGAGVPMRRAHPEAAAAAAVPWIKTRLFLATGDLEGGESLSSALARRGAVTQESLTLIRDGETTGNLEDALARSIKRRRDEYGRTMQRAARIVGAVAYAFAAASVLWIALNFYGNYYAAALRGGR